MIDCCLLINQNHKKRSVDDKKIRLFGSSNGRSKQADRNRIDPPNIRKCEDGTYYPLTDSRNIRTM